MRTYFVYEHWRPDTGVCFYVGKGKRWRPWDMNNRNPWHVNIQNKLIARGLTVEVRILAKGLTDDDAIRLEMLWIAHYGRKNLVNLTDGGDGRAGFTPSQETRDKIRIANTGKKCSDETKRKLSLHNTGRPLGPRKNPPKPYFNPGCFKSGSVPTNKGSHHIRAMAALLATENVAIRQFVHSI